MAGRSRLMIYDFEEGHAFPVLETEREISAPNWTPDGTALLVNGEGSLYWVDLDAPELLEIDTGLCLRLNNDHGITPDGETLLFSDHTFGEGAVIWRMALGEEEADPQRVTAKSPSWFHGVSPDGTTICYTAVREGLFGIYTAALDGTGESCVIEGAHHYDGPDFSADGEWLWFNSDRTGASELWRVRRDGSGLERMTDDALVNWFPHPSPDGEKVVYLAYPEGTVGHPADMHVSLRLWRAETGQTETLVEITGGQGTINVPSWSPDGVAFAYVDHV
ncbi:TolB family protein [Celeribacter indicus]|uniref:TolB-like protein n=1 Tax=Celeribacter indicus TaxID=1208324 RepID=A0A0B5E3G3_9RHOB|nr:PD40 domain-containing protein [Celeribacter indicus]AJE47611.1 TolB-like protein [Celeribacter indicus]SDW11859.1 WD40-like Beta Propeller Repeat [Celeribacter indicus]